MCLLVLAYKVHPEHPFILAANRDEFLDRPSLPADPWPEAPEVIAGRDLRGGGTWLGVSRSARFAALTNHRDLRRPGGSGPSRGLLVSEALRSGLGTVDTARYDGFNLLHGTLTELFYHNNIDGRHHALAPGIHGLSNHLLNTPWPKVRKAVQGMEHILSAGHPEPEDLLQLLMDTGEAEDHELPDTGLDRYLEKRLSAIHIKAEGYATRCSTVLMMDTAGRVRFIERGHHPRSLREHRFQVNIDGAQRGAFR